MLFESCLHAFEERIGHFLGHNAHEPCRQAGNRSDDGDIGRPIQPVAPSGPSVRVISLDALVRLRRIATRSLSPSLN